MNRFVSVNILRRHVIKWADGCACVLKRQFSATAFVSKPIVFSNPMLNFKPTAKPVKYLSTSTVRLQEEKGHDHAKLWIVEKATSASLVVIIPLGLLLPNKLFDSIIAILITAHSFWGMEALVVEYIRVILFGPMLPKVAMGVVYAFTVLILGGLFYLNFNDIGICRAFWRIWRNMRKPAGRYTKKCD